MRRPRARGHSREHGAGLGLPPRGPDPGERGQHANPAAVLDLRRGRGERGRIGRQAEVPAHPLEQGSSSEHPAVDRPLHPSIDAPGDGGEQPTPGLGPLGPRVGEHEDPGAVGRLDEPRLHAAGARESRLLVDEARAQRELDGPRVVVERAEVARRVHDLGQRAARHAEDLEQRRVPLGRAELGARCGRGVGCEAGAQPVAEERVDRAQPRRARFDRLGHLVIVLQEPGELPRREVGVERHPAELPDLVGAPLGLEPVEDLLRSLVLPGDDRRQRLSRLGVPRQHRLALVVEAAGRDLRAVGEELGHRLHHRAHDHLGVLLHPPRLRVVERLLAACFHHGFQVRVEEDRLHGGRALVDPEQVAHLESLNLRKRG